MSFFRVGPAGGWAVLAKLTSAQQNQLDIDHANALDKTGDSITAGNIHVSAGGRIWADSVETIVGNFFGSIQAIVTGGIISYAVGGIQAGTAASITSGGVAGGIAATNPGGIVSNATGGIAPTVASGITDGGVTGGIAATVPSGIVSGAAGGIAPTVATGISDGGVAAGISATVPGGIRTRDHVVLLGAVSTYAVDSASPGTEDDVLYVNSGTACAVTLPASPVNGRKLLIVFPTVAGSGAAGAGGSINTNGNSIRLSGITSGSPGTYPASPVSNHNLTFDLRFSLSGWIQVNGQV